MNAPIVQFNITNLSFSVGQILSGISCVSGVTLRGPFAKPDLLISSWQQFVNIYGGYISSSDFPLLCKRALDMGAQLRVNRQGHYATITSAASLDAVKATINAGKKATNSAALITSNVYNMVIVNGSNTVTIAQAFTTDNDTTMAAIVTTLNALSWISKAWVIPAGAGLVRSIMFTVSNNTAVSVSSSSVTLGSSQATITVSAITAATVVSAKNELLFTAIPKYQGVDYNNLSLSISAASNGNSAYFNMSIAHAIEPSLNETYQNLTVNMVSGAGPTIVQSTYLDAVKTASQLMDFTYLDLSASTSQVNPIVASYYYNTGSDGTTPATADYIGDSSGANGFYAFDSVDDALQFCAPEKSTVAIHVGGSAYAAARKDMMYIAHLDNANTTSASLIADRAGITADSYYNIFTAGGLSITDPITGSPKAISEAGDVLGIMAVNDSIGPWKQPAGTTRGQIFNALNVVNNFGTSARYNDINSLANRQINMVVLSGGEIYLNSAFTGALGNSKLNFVCTVRLLLWLQRVLAPTCKRYLQEPGDIPVFKALYREVQPTLDQLIVDQAVSQYAWQGDQDCKDLNSLVINNPTDLDNGKYKVRLFLKTISPIQSITVDMVITSTGINLSSVS